MRFLLALSSFLITFLASSSHGQVSGRIFGNDRIDLREPEPLRPDWAPFFHGVASGDPLPDRVVIWTRVTPENPGESGVEVTWRIATDTAYHRIVQSGSLETGPERDYTVKVDVGDLSPATTYYFSFTAYEKNSLTGRTRTAPLGDQAAHLRFGVVSCNSLQAGYFNAYGALARRADLDAIIALGDYIYEAPPNRNSDLYEERPIAPENRLVTLEDYRLRYGSYRLDTNLVRAHQQHPWIAVWDDHEFADNSYRDGASSHKPAEHGDWETRKQAAKQAFFEWIPMREPTSDLRIYRSLRYGGLVELFMLDTRVEGREKQIYDPFDPQLMEDSRTMLGETQKAWLFDQLGRSGARWKIIGQQVPFAQLELGWAASIDQDERTTYGDIQGRTQDAWNGYPKERIQILDFIEENDLENVVILSGSYHVSLAFDLSQEPVQIDYRDLPGGITPLYSPSDRYDPATGAGSVAVEFVTPSVTSNNFDENFDPFLASVLQALINQEVDPVGDLYLGNPNPHLKYPDLVNHGYMLLDVKPDSVQAEWFFHDKTRPIEDEMFGQAWYTRNGENHLRQTLGPSQPKASPGPPAPPDPPLGEITSVIPLDPKGPMTQISLHPNPFGESAFLEFTLKDAAHTEIGLYDPTGKKIRSLLSEKLSPGFHQLELDGSPLGSGMYFLRVQADKAVYSIPIIRQR